eukprot:Hpha_TRINITY_DN3234_c0_g1::TRINITY_DN3234_c0_g1_i1::g.186050::m.186050
MVSLVLAMAAVAYTEDGSAPYWERVSADPGCKALDTDCGFPGITEDQCHERSCCWDPNRPSLWCSGKPAECGGEHKCEHGSCNKGKCECDAGYQGWWCNDTVITTVHLIQSNHLDVGFSNLAAGVITEYFTHHIPLMISVGKKLRASDPERLRFLAQGYYINLYFNCPPGYGIPCPSSKEQEALKEAIRVGDVVFHAFPHNAELEVPSTGMVEVGLRQMQDLADSLGVPRPRYLSQRDVPGLPRSVIPLLRRHNVTTVTVGVNGASMYPRVPKVFRWHDKVSGEEVIAMWHPRGYGGYSVGEAVTVKGWGHALVTVWNGDNGGPYSADTYREVFLKLKAEFPGAAIVASTFDNFTDQLRASGLYDSLPVVDEEIGDSWIYGVPSDPKKIAYARALDRAWNRYLDAGGVRDAAYTNASLQVIKNCEHTWGKDVKSTVKDDASWSNSAFLAAKTTGPSAEQYQTLEKSWWEQRDWGVTFPLQALPPSHPLKKIAEEEVAGVVEAVPDLQKEGFSKASPGSTFTCGSTTIGFDKDSGAVTTLVDGRNNQSWGGELFTFAYRSYSQEDFLQFQRNYGNQSNPPDYFKKDFGKPGDNVSQHLVWHGELDSLWVKQTASECSFGVLTRIVDDHGDTSVAHDEYGAPSRFLSLYSLPPGGGGSVNVTIWCVNKTSTRLPESMFVSFLPKGSGAWEMNKLGQWQSTGGVVPGGSWHLHGVEKGFRFSVGGRNLTVFPLDAPVINLGEPLGFPVVTANVSDPWAVAPDLARFGVSSVLWNNLWGTNYVQWYPFFRDGKAVPGEENFISRYTLRF